MCQLGGLGGPAAKNTAGPFPITYNALAGLYIGGTHIPFFSLSQPTRLSRLSFPLSWNNSLVAWFMYSWII